MTIDLLFDDDRTLDRVVASEVLTPDLVAELYGVSPTDVKIVTFVAAKAIKITFPKNRPNFWRTGRPRRIWRPAARPDRESGSTLKQTGSHPAIERIEQDFEPDHVGRVLRYLAQPSISALNLGVREMGRALDGRYP